MMLWRFPHTWIPTGPSQGDSSAAVVPTSHVASAPYAHTDAPALTSLVGISQPCSTTLHITPPGKHLPKMLGAHLCRTYLQSGSRDSCFPLLPVQPFSRAPITSGGCCDLLFGGNQPSCIPPGPAQSVSTTSSPSLLSSPSESSSSL